ncbi:MAG: acetyl-CoA C-acyltransferase FadI [Acidobacteria bacterium]|nr:acetyl-CoA C-acyltransferase FadI [Acidobacteriota bacterium]
MNETTSRVAIVRGLRTPFAKAGTAYSNVDALELGKIVVSELVQRSEIDPETIDHLVFGTVIPSIKAANIAREIVLGTGLSRRIPAHTVSQACASGNQAVTSAADSIHRGYNDIVIAGGSESLSTVPILFSKKFAETLVAASRQKSPLGKLKAFSRLRPQHLAPDIPAIAESTTGLTMGQSAEVMAKENKISREAQDRFALQSHVRAAAAFESGRFADEVMTVIVPDDYKTVVERDNLIRSDTTLEKLSELKPVFDKKYGTLTAGNSSALTDGAAAVLLMSEKKAEELGLEPLAFVRSYAYAALDPFEQLLQGPAFAVPQALDRAGLKLDHMDVIEMHEAFAAQVLSNIQWLVSEEFAVNRLGRNEAVGEVDPEKINLTGGSIAIGHPFAATGARIVTTVANELKLQNKRYGLVSVCAAGAQGSAIVLERA